MEYIKLNSGEQMPIVGTGTNTYGKENNQYRGKLNGDFTVLEDAIDLGYRSIDAAVSYSNEAGVGETLAKSKISREDFFITSKLPINDEYISTKDAVRKTINNSLKNFHTDYLDLYLIHHPIENKEYFKQTWEVFEEYYKNGKLKSIGVSNFDEELLNEMKKFATVKPAVNQIPINLKEPNQELIELLKSMEITPVAWGPMDASGEQIEALTEIGKAYNKSWAQVLLRYQIQRGIVVIPKSHNKNNQAANLDLFNFELSEEDVNKVSHL
ncbi:Aldo/keto reductase [Atopostipes suicloacalis DSM 15692]|uniref:Aldo/keto reductase n=1 Tax=Atopostipes suicloacalis DSM 15692 TaxID=1121025 RepID=A0A1M4ZQ63_9LACT|nr:aldo/keto reductase [Atopostipes suicloacalis]SHF20240.1 Aldo/keto reductase [Atopostipes suicloacalis DSM 15692]